MLQKDVKSDFRRLEGCVMDFVIKEESKRERGGKKK